ncbi:hypothetical protein PQX77_018423 [Marasmius sp. AFHP31]|nr:hypothetical protein PQX77_018423 [Marasmius sp. AFHP31]
MTPVIRTGSLPSALRTTLPWNGDQRVDVDENENDNNQDVDSDDWSSTDDSDVDEDKNGFQSSVVLPPLTVQTQRVHTSTEYHVSMQASFEHDDIPNFLDHALLLGEDSPGLGSEDEVEGYEADGDFLTEALEAEEAIQAVTNPAVKQMLISLSPTSEATIPGAIMSRSRMLDREIQTPTTEDVNESEFVKVPRPTPSEIVGVCNNITGAMETTISSACQSIGNLVPEHRAIGDILLPVGRTSNTSTEGHSRDVPLKPNERNPRSGAQKSTRDHFGKTLPQSISPVTLPSTEPITASTKLYDIEPRATGKKRRRVDQDRGETVQDSNSTLEGPSVKRPRKGGCRLKDSKPKENGPKKQTSPLLTSPSYTYSTIPLDMVVKLIPVPGVKLRLAVCSLAEELKKQKRSFSRLDYEGRLTNLLDKDHLLLSKRGGNGKLTAYDLSPLWNGDLGIDPFTGYPAKMPPLKPPTGVVQMEVIDLTSSPPPTPPRNKESLSLSRFAPWIPHATHHTMATGHQVESPYSSSDATLRCHAIHRLREISNSLATKPSASVTTSPNRVSLQVHQRASS